MKKVFSLILAVVMVASLASVAFAEGSFVAWDAKSKSSSSVTALAVKNYDNKGFYTYDTEDHLFTYNAASKSVTFGKTAYYPLFVETTTDEGNPVVATQDKSVSSLKLAYTVENGAAYVEDVKIVKKYGAATGTNEVFGYVKVSGTNTVIKEASATDKFSGYYIAVSTKGSSTATQYLSGIITLTGKTGSGSDKLKDETVHFDIQLAWTSYVNDTRFASAEPSTLANVKFDYDEDNIKTYLVAERAASTTLGAVTYASSDVEYVFNSASDTVKFTVDMVSGEKVLIKYSEKADEAIEAANEEAGIAFYNFNGASFKRSGDLFFEQDLEDEDAYLYEILADGSLKNLTACYDEEEGGFMLKVKKLGFYCVSDLPLVDAEGTVAAVAGAVNPTTGAIA